MPTLDRAGFPWTGDKTRWADEIGMGTKGGRISLGVTSPAASVPLRKAAEVPEWLSSGQKAVCFPLEAAGPRLGSAGENNFVNLNM